MKNIRSLIFAVGFTLVLSLPTYAGDIATGIVSTPRSSPSTVTANGDIATGIVGQMDTPNAAGDIHTTAPTDSVFEAALNLVRGVLSLF